MLEFLLLTLLLRGGKSQTPPTPTHTHTEDCKWEWQKLDGITALVYSCQTLYVDLKRTRYRLEYGKQPIKLDSR